VNKTDEIEPFILEYQSHEVKKATRRVEEKERLKRNREALRIQREIDEERKARKNTKPKRVLTVTHHPTYAVLRHKRLDGEKDSTSRPQCFTIKSEIQSVKSQTRIKNAINWMLLFADVKRCYSKKGWINKRGEEKHNFYFRLGFITLTLPTQQKHTDEYIKEHMLQPLLYFMSRYYQTLYVWKAESQLNGNIHFHITVDTYIPWKAIATKWNQICAKHNYCKVFTDGTNDQNNASTQIKAVLSEKKCANDIGGYMSKKDRLALAVLKAFNQLVHGNKKFTPDIKEAYDSITKKKEVTDNKEHMLSVVKGSLFNANLHCKFTPGLVTDAQDTMWYKRVIDGRLWGCSENLSKISIFIDETYTEFEKEEQIFFRQNADVYNLGKAIATREKQKYSQIPEPERQVRYITDEDIEKRTSFMENVFIHPHLSTMKKGATLQKMIHDEKLIRQKNFQTYFNLDSYQ
jgi:hypothetical protein